MLTNGLPQALSSGIRNLGWILPASTASTASTASNANGENETVDAPVSFQGALYFPVSENLQRLLALDTATEKEVDAAFAGAALEKRDAELRSTRVRVRRYNAHTPEGLQYFFRHHASGSVLGIAKEHRDELARLSRGEITIAAGDAALHTVVRTIPAGTLQKDSARFRGWYVKPLPPTWHSVYPTVASGRKITSVTHMQADGSRKPVQVAIHDNRHSYSLDKGLTWTPTGAIHDQAAQDARAAAWSQFFNNRANRARTLQSEANKGHGG